MNRIGDGVSGCVLMIPLFFPVWIGVGLIGVAILLRGFGQFSYMAFGKDHYHDML